MSEELTGRELDAAIAEKIMGWEWCLSEGLRSGGYWRIDDQHSMIGIPWHPYTDLNACFKALRQFSDKTRAVFSLSLDDPGKVCPGISVALYGPGFEVKEYGAFGEEALTICRALLRAIESEK